MDGVFDVYWRIDKVARAMKCSTQTVYRLIKEGYFPSARKAAPDGCVGQPGWEIKMRDVHAAIAKREEEKNKPRERKAKSKNNDAETIELLKELHATMVKQTEIIGKLIEKGFASPLLFYISRR